MARFLFRLDPLLRLRRRAEEDARAALGRAIGAEEKERRTLARLEEENVVAGYTVRLGNAFAASRVRAHMMIKTLPRFHREVEQALAAFALVQAIHAISGEYDIIAMLEAEDGAQLNELIDEIGLLDGVERTTTSVILATKVER